MPGAPAPTRELVDVVISQEPGPASEVQRGATIELVVHGAFDPEQGRGRECRQLVSEGMRAQTSGNCDRALQLYDDIRRQSHRSLLHRVGERWERRLLLKGTAPWKCRAGARFLYVDEAGIVSYCSQRRGEPGVPLLTYTMEHLRSGRQRKGCEEGCTLSCVRRASAPDAWRA